MNNRIATLLCEPSSLPRGADLSYEDDQNLESDWHRDAMNLLIHLLRYHWQDRQDIYVAGNMFIYFNPDQATTRNFRGPDLFVIHHAKGTHLRNSWVLWEEQGRGPSYVLELASPSTLKADLGEKKTVYEQELEVPEYMVYNPATQQLRGWRLNAQGRYGELTPDNRGWLWSEQLGLWLGKAQYRFSPQYPLAWVLRFFEPDGSQLPTQAEAQTKLTEEGAKRAKAADRRADQEATERRRLEAELAQLRAQLQGHGKT